MQEELEFGEAVVLLEAYYLTPFLIRGWLHLWCFEARRLV